MALHLHRTPDNAFGMDPIPVILERHDLAVHHIAFLAAEFQAFERPVVAVNSRQIAGNEEANLLTPAARYTYQHPMPCCFTESSECSSHAEQNENIFPFRQGRRWWLGKPSRAEDVNQMLAETALT
ncbi:hypothetical protein [Phyllobacterium zundukense]|uniref:hypothetical protein n=1 Tax=Phyllobacterium zundukense TaxID=1867719 RepID=UPI0010565777|nr:hypothetical protein [Phyllobacterium zundukense]